MKQRTQSLLITLFTVGAAACIALAYNFGGSVVSAQAPADGCATASFAAARNFAVDFGPSSVTTGDFNADGKLDLATANDFSDNVSVLLGNGAGGFAAAANFAVGNSPRSVTTGDFNADGKLDLATANNFSSNVSVLLGNGAGGFAAAQNFPAGSGTYSVTTADFNADGKLDLATANGLSDNVSVLLGDGAGGFAAAVNFAAGRAPFSVTTADFNADGKLDLATANVNSTNVSVLLGNGAGGFSAAQNFAAGNSPASVTTGDFNADGKLDLAAANGLSDNVSVLLGDGAGGFSAAQNFAAGDGSRSVTTGDFNADGKLDLATANAGFDNVSVLLGNGAGGFAAAQNFAAGDGPYSVTTGDFNADGKLDLATANFNSARVSVLLNDCTANAAPVAVCRDVNLSVVTGCAVNITAAQVDGGSYDPDGDSISPSLDNYGPFGPGSRTVTLTVTDSHGASDSCTATVTVEDAAAPRIACAGIPAQTAIANASCQATVPDVRTLVRNQSSDNCTHRASLVITQSPTAGSLVGPGSNPITVTVKDAANNSAMCVVGFTVTDNTAPTLMLNPDIALWPPDHMYRTLTVSQMAQSVTDGCNTALNLNDVKIEKVTSDEPDNVKGASDGETTNDILIAADCKSVQLRSERDEKKNGRVYVVTLRVRDASGNTTRADFKVSVPPNQSGAQAVQDAAALTRTSSCP